MITTWEYVIESKIYKKVGTPCKSSARHTSRHVVINVFTNQYTSSENFGEVTLCQENKPICLRILGAVSLSEQNPGTSSTCVKYVRTQSWRARYDKIQFPLNLRLFLSYNSFVIMLLLNIEFIYLIKITIVANTKFYYVYKIFQVL